MELPATGISELTYQDGSLCFCGRPVAELVAATGTPAFLFSESRLRANCRGFRQAFRLPSPWNLKMAYSVKTAWEPRLLKLMAALGTGAEVACEHELELALRAGFQARDVFLDGPAHTQEIVAKAVERGVRFVKLDSLDQLRLAAEAAGAGGDLGVCLRIKAPGARWIGKPSGYLDGRFGMGADELKSALEFLKANSQTDFRGLAVHMGSQVTGPKAYRDAIKALAGAFSLAGEMGLEGREADVGGGFPSRTLSSASLGGLLRNWFTGADGKVPPLEDFGGAVARALASAEFPPKVRDLVLEPGRALVGDASILVSRVVAVKPGWLVLDASHNFVPESLLFAARRFLPAEPQSGLPWSRVNLSGSTLSGGDVLALGSKFPPCSVDDIVVMMDAGAYTLSRANRFTTLVPPAFLLAASGDLQSLRRKETAEDVVEESESW
jgi:diaminopimelate decarboxylase